MIKKIIFTLTLLITISMCLMSCGQSKLEKYFDIEMTSITEKTIIYPSLSNLYSSPEFYYGTLIEPKGNLDLKVDGKVIFKKIKFSFYDSAGSKRFFSNEGEFEIELNGIGTNRYGTNKYYKGVGNVYDLSMIKNMDGKAAFPDYIAIAKLDSLVEIVEYDAYFEGTVEKR